jgi:hypothetical protein
MDKGLDYTNFELVDEYWTRFEGNYHVTQANSTMT